MRGWYSRRREVGLGGRVSEQVALAAAACTPALHSAQAPRLNSIKCPPLGMCAFSAGLWRPHPRAWRPAGPDRQLCVHRRSHLFLLRVRAAYPGPSLGSAGGSDCRRSGRLVCMGLHGRMGHHLMRIAVAWRLVQHGEVCSCTGAWAGAFGEAVPGRGRQCSRGRA